MANRMGHIPVGGFSAGGIGRQQNGIFSVKQSKWSKWANNAPKKKLKYNEREISSQILRASKSRNASEVLTRAKGKLGVLKRCQVTGQYDEGELRAALKHAEKMVRCAKMKMMHLKDEEREDSRNQRTKARKPKRVKDAQEAELREKRLKHRLKERKKILEANLEYIKEKRENESNSDRSVGATLDLSSYAMQLQQLEAESKNLEQEIALEEMSLDAAGMSEVSASADGGSLPVSVSASVTADAGAAAATTVDIAI